MFSVFLLLQEKQLVQIRCSVCFPYIDLFVW